MPKAKISISIDVDLIVWMDKQVEKGLFKSRSDAVQHCVKGKMLEGYSGEGYFG